MFRDPRPKELSPVATLELDAREERRPIHCYDEANRLMRDGLDNGGKGVCLTQHSSEPILRDRLLRPGHGAAMKLFGIMFGQQRYLM